MKREVLVIAYYFPPMGLSGVQRTVKFVKYLPEHGWQPVVLTVSPGGYYAYDESLLREVEGAGVDIVRTDSYDPTRFYRKGEAVKMPREPFRKLMNRMSQSIFFPDNKIGWKGEALKKARELVRDRSIELIFSTAPPFTDHIIGRDLSKEVRLPLVLDYRDAWLDYQFAFYPTPLHKYRHYLMEQSCVRASRNIVVVNRKIKVMLLEHYKFLRYNDVHIIPQGYDPADFADSGGTASPDSQVMRITHTGTFIEDITPVPLLRAVAGIFNDKPEMKGRIKLSFAGVFRREHAAKIKKLGLQDDVDLLGYIDHAECTKLMMNSDVLFITLGKKKNHEHHTTGKLYDYFGARKPILACVPDGSVKQTVEETQAGIITDPDDVDGIAAAIMTFFEKFNRRELLHVPETTVQKYNRQLLTAELAGIFNKATEN
jgi:glycosyltransferase involved in cell wall biosynthesis